ncbi:BnaC09g31500D [Brassica napus]|uniref:BnaC09g31500D protein n=1 Tax=Brassica napus TaxID=3708 RepID=A0A078G382_BRANA|nr:BnaC09g31500D [Brassica napus]
MTQFPILDLPSVVQALVVERVANNSFADLYRLRSTCKSMRALADDGGVYASFDLYNYPWYLGTQHLLLRRCYEEGNPSTLYVKGVEYFYGLDRLDQGLRLLKRVVDAGYERALYTYAMTRQIFWEDEEYVSRFTRESVGRMGMVVRNEDPIWFNNENDQFITKRHLFMSTVVPLFYSCQCSPCLDRDWVLWYIEHNKAGDMCNCCFWIKEVALFYGIFSVALVFLISTHGSNASLLYYLCTT